MVLSESFGRMRIKHVISSGIFSVVSCARYFVFTLVCFIIKYSCLESEVFSLNLKNF